MLRWIINWIRHTKSQSELSKLIQFISYQKKSFNSRSLLKKTKKIYRKNPKMNTNFYLLCMLYFYQNEILGGICRTKNQCFNRHICFALNIIPGKQTRCRSILQMYSTYSCATFFTVLSLSSTSRFSLRKRKRGDTLRLIC